ncbi:hypothetical protein PRIPAC_88745 [Pristionchus pacificus]|uniref:Dehydrogenase n=1 Tax=Pristionchus pacificus TaxID=54126 RepID=A0A2A6CWB8_PRIPA|nr:hypothetical protein PRIPAC_88745 [Pristionchus pacificus]|eukprot:PDM82311.1 dehydrogenase [Pristionchus pacificus]
MVLLTLIGYSALALVAYPVTGATDGIGKAYATALAKKKFNVFLISRTQSKLDETKKEIEALAPGVEIRTFAFDFGATTRAAYEPLLSELRAIELGILVNNVGYSFEYPEILHATEGGLERLAGMTTINSLPPVLLSAVALEQMSKRKAGIVINIASGAAYHEASHWNVYSAAKRFVLHLSGILRTEYAPAGVTVQCISPMLVATKMAKIRRSSFFVPSADAFVAQALRSVGLVGETTGCYAHQILVEAVNALPAFARDSIINKHTLVMHDGALAKRAKKMNDALGGRKNA